MDLKSAHQNSTQFDIKPPRQVALKSAWFWINEGFRYLMQGKLMWLVSLSLYASLFALTNSLLPPAIFIMAILILSPVVIGGIAIACFEIENGKKMSVEYLISGFKCKNNASLFRYGFVLFLLIFLAQIISSTLLTSMGVTQEQLESAMKEVLADPNADIHSILAFDVLTKSMIIGFITLLPVQLINLLAPNLLALSNYTPWQTVITCFKAVFINIHVFIVYIILFFALAILPVVLYNYLIEMMINMFGGIHLIFSYLVLSVLFIYLMFVTALFYCSAYVAFKDIFLGDEI
jgi:hypothetical protein